MPSILISVHLPKTAGTSFATSLHEHYGHRFFRDYADLPLNTPVLQRKKHAIKMSILNSITPPKDIECIHGHFMPLKYRFLRHAKFITWMRDPTERLASHYYYWLNNYNPEKAPLLHKKVIEEQWSLEQFCLAPQLRNLYSQFLWGFPVKRFDFIGITEFYESDIQYFSNKFFNFTFKTHKKNINTRKHNRSYFTDQKLLDEIRGYHAKDMQLYQHMLTVRLKRCQGPL